jgi:D-alanyl-D-alanine carboxypeptidase
MMEWLMRLLRREAPPERTDSHITHHDAAIAQLRQDYQDDKRALEAKERQLIERLARMNRLGYDFDVTTRKPARHEEPQ